MAGMTGRIAAALAMIAATSAFARTGTDVPQLPTAAPAPAPAPAPQDDGITVEARTRAQTSALVRSVIDPSRGRYIPTFRESLCVRVQGLQQPYAGMLRARINTAAQDAGLRVRSGNCSPNMLVVAPVDPDKAAAKLVDHHPMLFGDPTEGVASPRLLAALRRPHAIRWFGTTTLVGNNRGMWRLKAQAQARKMAAYILLDLTKMEGMDWNSIGDFVAMAVLSNAQMDTIYPANATILSVFDDRTAGHAGPTRLTSFDRSLLQALYTVDQDLTPEQQRQEIIKRIERAPAD